MSVLKSRVVLKNYTIKLVDIKYIDNVRWDD